MFFLFACGISITAGYHRLWSHRAYGAHWSVRLFFMIFGAMALQNSILIWGSQHRTHHRFVDDVDKDPYSAKRGFWFSHMGWILRNYPSGRNDFTNARDLERDPIVMFQHRYYLPLDARARTSACRWRSAGRSATCGACSCSAACCAW